LVPGDKLRAAPLRRDALIAFRAYCVLQTICRFEKSKSLKMTRRERWRRVLDIEVRRWSAMTPEQLASALNKERVYEVELDSKTYQVEVEMLKSTEEYFQVMVAVDDGSLPASIVPETQIFICNKKFRNL
jgi:hypothetical protein